MSGYREAPDGRSGLVTAALARTLEPLGFRAKAVGESLEFVRYAFGSLTSDGMDVVAIKGAWVHRTWNHNDAVVHVGAPDDSAQRLSDLALRIEEKLAKPIGYVWYFKPILLHVVWSGERLLERSKQMHEAFSQLDLNKRKFGVAYVANRQDPRSNLMSISIVDLVAKRVIRDSHDRLTRSKPLYEAIGSALTTLVT